MRILFADKFPSKQLEKLQRDGHETSLQPDLQADAIPSVIAGQEVLVVRGYQGGEADSGCGVTN